MGRTVGGVAGTEGPRVGGQGFTLSVTESMG